MQLQAELDQEKRTTARLTGELSSNIDQMNTLVSKAAALEAEVSGYKAQLLTKDESIKDLRHSQALWSSMHMAQGQTDPTRFTSFMGATSMKGESSDAHP